jgi:hypothetical protein
MDEVRRAAETLREEGFAVDGITDVGPDEDGHGVAFSLNVYAPSRTGTLDDGDAGEDDETTVLPDGGIVEPESDGTARRALLDAVDRLDRGKGVERDDLLREAGKQGYRLPVLKNTLSDLERRGEVYKCDGGSRYRKTPDRAP